MSHSLQSIADAISAEAVGDVSFEINGLAEPQTAGPGDLAIAMSPKYAEGLANGSARAAIMWAGADWQSYGLACAILVTRARYAMSGLTRIMDPGQHFGTGIHPTAVIDETATIGENASIGALSVIGPNARIGANAVIGPHVTIGADVAIGDNAMIREQVSVGARVEIGDNFWSQPGARIGSDGFSYVTPELSSAESARMTLGDQGDAKSQAYARIHSLGSVKIGDDVEIGANATIDNGTIRDTVIGDGCKLDNQVHVGHNCRIGKHCLLCGQSGLSGSVDVGDYVVLGGQTGVADNTFVGDRAILSGATKAVSNVPAGRVMMGYPAVKMDLHTEIYKAQRRLPRLLRDVAELKKAVFKSGSSD